MHNNPERTTPIGMARYAFEFLEAARTVDDKIGSQPGYEIVPPIPVLYLAGHAIELSLKAYLLSRGVALREVRQLGHNLHACLRKAKELGLLDIVQFTGQEMGAVEILDGLYSTKQLEYIVTGAKQFPIFGPVESFAVRLFNAVSDAVGFDKRLEVFGGGDDGT
jgi:hypothetical protein